MEPYAGQYDLSPGVFRVWLEGGQLFVGAEGQPAIDALAPPEDPKENEAQASEARAIVEGLRTSDFTPLKNARGGNRPLPRYAGRLQARLIDPTKGNVKALELLGNSRSPLPGALTETFVRITYDHAADVYRLVWNHDHLLEGIDWESPEVRSWQTYRGLPYVVAPGNEPGMMPCMPQSPVDFACYAVESSFSRIVQLHFTLDATGVSGVNVESPGSRAIHAKRLQKAP
jgi:hypothetical protein